MGSQRVRQDWVTFIFTHVPILFQILPPHWLLQSTEQSSPCLTAGPCWSSVLFRVAGKLILFSRETSRDELSGAAKTINWEWWPRVETVFSSMVYPRIYRALCHAGGLWCLSILYLIVRIWQLQTPIHPSPTHPLGNYKSVLYVCVTLPVSFHRAQSEAAGGKADPRAKVSLSRKRHAERTMPASLQ